MPMASIERDLAVMFDAGVFASEVTVYPGGASNGTKISGIFDDGDVPVEELGSNIESYVKQTKLHCRTSDVTGVVPNDVVNISGVDYYVAFTVDDGTGTTELILSTDTL